MPDISYDPAFHHKQWVNNVDRIRAGGPNGFNVRFGAIESDFHQLSTVVTQVESALNQLISGGPPEAGLRRLGIPIAFVVSGGNWFLDQNGTAVASQPGGLALIPLSLPDRVQLQSLRALGLFPGPPISLTVQLCRAPLTNGAQDADVLAQFTGSSPGMTNPYDQTAAVNPALRAVDLTTFRYFVRAQATGVTFSTPPTSLHALQIAYTA